MAYVSIVKRWFNVGLWVLATFIVFGLFAAWDAYQVVDFGQDERNRFVLAVIVTSTLIMAWVWLLIAKHFVEHFLRTARVVRGWRAHTPWWLVQILSLVVVAVFLGVSISKLSLEMTSEFGLLKKNNYTELQRRIIKYRPILNVVDKSTGFSLMQMAFLKNDLKAIRLFTKYGADPLTALELDNFSAFAANSKIIKFLVDHKMDPNAKDAAGVPLLFYMVKIGNIKGLELLLKAGADPEKSGTNENPLIVSIQQGMDDIAKLLVEYKANLNVQDEQGDTPLHVCVKRYNYTLLEFLLEKGANPRIFNFADMSPIHLAARMGAIESIKIFLKKDPSLVHLCSKETDRTPFADAIRGEHFQTARFLLKNGAQINRVLKSGFTILHSMLISRELGKAMFLVEEGADIHIVCKSVRADVNDEGETAYHYMRRKKMRKLLKLVDKREGTHSFEMKKQVDDESEKPKKKEKELPPIL